MSAKTIGFPSSPSLDQEYQGWVWDGEKWVSDAVKGGLWEESGDDIYYNDGNVGIGAAPDSSGDKLQVEGNGTFSGTVKVADGAVIEKAIYLSASGAVFKNDTSGSGVIVTNNGLQFDPIVDDQMNLGNPERRWKDATFSGNVISAGNVNADKVSARSIYRPNVNGAGIRFSTNNQVLPADNAGESTDGVTSLGQQNGGKWKDAYFSGTVDAGGFTINGVPISGGGGGLPDGDFTHNGIITATDFIATSDERLKDNITTAPVGLIDSLKGREWDWKESGGKGSGVVAQELEQVLPHLVHEDDEGKKSVSYMGLCAYLIEELKDCRERLAVLEAKA